MSAYEAIERTPNGDLNQKKTYCSSNFGGKHVYTFSLWLCYFFHGWINAMFGPTLLAFQEKTDVSFNTASVYLISYHTGKPIGAICCSLLFRKKISTATLLAITLFSEAICLCCVPWVTNFWALCVFLLTIGILHGILSPVVMAELCFVWDKDIALPMTMSHLLNGCGEIISPLLLSIFLPAVSFLNETGIPAEISNSTKFICHFGCESNDTEIWKMPKICVPYTMTSGCFCLLGLGMLLNRLVNTYVLNTIQSPETQSQDKAEIPKNAWSIIILGICCLYGFFLNGVTRGMIDYQPSFVVKTFNWSQRTASKMNSLFSLTMLAGRLVSLITISRFKNMTLILAHTLSGILSVVWYVLFVLLGLDSLLWLPLAFLGLSTSILLPLVVILLQMHVCPVTGIVSSIFVISISLGGVFNAFIIGQMFELISPFTFIYTEVTEYFIMLVLVLIIVCLLKKKSNNEK